MTEEIIINKEICSRYWNGNCTGDNELLIGACPDIDCEIKQILRMKQENEELKKILQQTKQEVSKLSDKVPQMIMRNKELEKENEELKKTLHQPDFMLALADISNGARDKRINRLARYENVLRKICDKSKVLLTPASRRFATNSDLYGVIAEFHVITSEVLKCQKY